MALFKGIVMKLMQGDCLDRMGEIPDCSIDMVLTDPPYGMKFQSSYRIVQHSKIKNDNELSWLNQFVDEMYRTMRDDSAGYVFCSFHHIDMFKQALQQKFKIKNNTGLGKE